MNGPKRYYFLSLPRPYSHNAPRMAQATKKSMKPATTTGKTITSLRPGAGVGINDGNGDGMITGDGVKFGGPYMGGTGETGGGPYFTTGS